MSKKADFADSVGNEQAALCNDAFDGSAALAPTNVGHDAVGAEVVAAAHDGYPGVMALRPMARKIRREARAGFLGIDFDGTLLVSKGIREKPWQAAKGACAKDHVDVGDV